MNLLAGSKWQFLSWKEDAVDCHGIEWFCVGRTTHFLVLNKTGSLCNLEILSALRTKVRLGSRFNVISTRSLIFTFTPTRGVIVLVFSGPSVDFKVFRKQATVITE